MQPFCNKVTVTLTGTPTGFALTGFDDLCGAGQRASVVGTAVLNPDGTAGVNFVVVPSPGGAGIQVAGVVSPASGQGTWSDSLGNSGTFALGGAVPGLPTRPIRPVVVSYQNNTELTFDACLSSPPLPLVLCGRDAFRWLNPVTGESLQVWRDAAGLVHIRGRVFRAGTISANGGNPIVLVLPVGMRPVTSSVHMVGTTASISVTGSNIGTARIQVLSATSDTPGAVRVLAASEPFHSQILFGEIIFSVDR